MTAQHIISLWPSRRALAGDLGLELAAVHKWFGRNSIPAEHDLALVAAAERRGLAVSLHDLAGLRAK